MASTSTSTLEPPKMTDAEKAAVSKSPKYLTDLAALISLTFEIRKSTGFVNADLDECLLLLEKFKDLQFTELMLKLNPDCVRTIKLLTDYVGNLEDWEMAEKEKLDFAGKAKEIRKQARSIFNNIKSMLKIPEPFWERFLDESLKTGWEYQAAWLNAEDSVPKAN